MEKEANTRARKGAKYMDVVRPEWYKEVSPDTLEMSNASVCILGQTFSDYWEALERLDITDEMAVSLGFIAAGRFDYNKSEVEFECLTHAWQNELMKRRRAM